MESKYLKFKQKVKELVIFTETKFRVVTNYYKITYELPSPDTSYGESVIYKSYIYGSCRICGKRLRLNRSNKNYSVKGLELRFFKHIIKEHQ